MANKKQFLNLISVALLVIFVWWGEAHLDPFIRRVLLLGAIYGIASVGYNVINGLTGQFSLGPHGFMLIGAYTVALFVLPSIKKPVVWLFQPLIWPLSEFSLPEIIDPRVAFFLALLVAGIIATCSAFLVGIPSLRVLHGDYLAIATFGFGEIIFMLAVNLIPITNGPMGITGIPEYTNLWWAFGTLGILAYAALLIKKSSYGRALRAIREDELVAESMGINVFRHKMLAFLFSAFCAGVAGGLYATYAGAITPDPFKFTMTFNLLIIIVLGGLGSTTGSVITGFLFAGLLEGLRFLDNIVPGMRMVFFAALLIVLMIFFRKGLFGDWEFSWDALFRGFSKLKGRAWKK